MRLTIAIPTLDRAHCVGRAIDSALAQTGDGVEVLVSNNGSTDDTRAVLDSYSDPRLRIVHHATTMPPAEHGNFLIGAATGDLFVGLSDDDYLEPSFAQRVIAMYDGHPEISFAYTGCWTHAGDAVLESPGGPEIEDPLTFLHEYFSGRRHVFWCACVTRTADLRRIGGLPAGTVLGDMYLWTQIALQGPVGCVSELLSHYTYLAGNQSLGVPVCVWASETHALMERVAARLAEPHVPRELSLQIRAAMARYLARTTANQFALSASRGASKRSLIRALKCCTGALRGDLATALPRVVAALALPPSVARVLVAKYVVTRSRWGRREAA